MSPVRYELGFDIPEDDILHSHRHGNSFLVECPYAAFAAYLYSFVFIYC
jgi:hypothetical protein